MPIRVLPPEIAQKIAAGEVIERPASVIKELVENSIDAGAKNIRVEIKNGGLALMRVSDDGCGIPFEQVPTAFERHATSKIVEPDDLYRLTTLGFRGEALPSIASVSQMTLLTRPRNSEESGSEIAFEDGQRAYHRPAGAPPGTIITVRNLFYNLPARQKWSRSGTSEAGHILNILNSYALAYPEIKFALASEGRTVLQTSGNGDLRDAISKVYGAELAQAMLPIQPEEEENPEEGKSHIVVTGFTADPSASKPNRNFMQFFINRRWVQSRLLTYAVQEAYTSLIMSGRFPACVVLIEIDPAEVDVNVHPAKTEVRFLYERRIFGAVQKAVRAALVAGSKTPAWSFTAPPAPPPRSGLFQTFDRLYAPSEEGQAATPDVEMQATLDLPHNAAGVDLMDEAAFSNSFEAIAAPESVPMIAPEHSVMTKPRLPLLRVIGQVSGTYVVAEGPDGMYLIDQHAAHERVMYERFQALVNGKRVESQLLLEALLLDFTPRQRLMLENEEHRHELEELGFQLEPFGDLTYRLLAVPAMLFGRDALKSLGEMLDEAEGMRDGGCNPSGSDLLHEPDTNLPRSWRDKLSASLACHAAVRAGQTLNTEEMRELITQLERCENPRACAHGRPTMIHLSQGQLEKGFGRK
ncbi:MAG: DNA mismatch repair endonuclease MutL [Chloroflexi bacterium]|uniref:DNA mismatch repair protein MutL n=1 Tax=Candidatus Chlorohelix allophototropha TaxID=3003348 RepID=A0A8T7M2A0_9CHLR|nr:DNA mismatch repair endonuclease MutL [Chloroflexota bacterium]WJW67931.1 DNA mismatch repair endonuclease MutL [Chloroflexota bacterium L227-S17]